MPALVSHYVPMVQFDPDSSEPKYRQILAILREGIADGTYPPGAALPSIQYLRQEYGVAGGTARLVLRTLVDEGLAYTRSGKGTYVTQKPPP